ncbi:hypothetical protein pdam_00011853 [Pocillopora damicornis]|uniref:ShKT domain-containing protein n=1 Tax=Pocillopora damicornis TaxID=46731 RepID=A0A3M6TMU6_POCDA|nr:uncharacterized protein LOC113675632 [Pocillopora damicornis]RMX42689.1 hypothetical protein pdam_00011853 [Pocillopora damicornis]
MLLDQRKNIDWQNWNNFLERFVCACANKTVTDGCAYFGIQFWAECWAGENLDVAYNSDGQSNYCFGHDFLPCARVSSSCAGAKDVNFVYKIEVDQPPDACRDQDPVMCQKHLEFCDSYVHMAKMCPRTCNLCRD